MQLDTGISMEGLINLAKKKEESTNEKIVRLYKEGYSFDEISRSMNNIPKANVIGIVEKYFPEYKSYVQPKVDHSITDDNDKAQKAKFPGVGFLKRNPKADDHPVKITVNLDMDDEGFLDKHTEGIAKMLKDGRSVNDIAEFFNKDKADILAVRDVMDEHFRRVEACKKAEPAPAKTTEPEDNKFSNFATGLEGDQIAKPVRHKYTPPTYSKRDDPKPVSASYGLASNEPAAEEKPVEETVKAETSIDTIDEAELLRKAVEEANLPPVIEKEEVEEHKVSLLPSDDDNGSGEHAVDHKVSLIDDVPEDPAMDEILEIPSIESVSPEELEKELTKAPEPVEDIPEIGYENNTEEVVSKEVKEVYPGMSALEKMKQFAQEQIAANNKKIEELKSKKTDAENDAFDCNTKVEMMKKEIEEMQAKLLVLIDEKDKAGKVVSDINEEIEAINKENADYGTYL
ncbi:hypothetical protein SAMN05216469_101193 [Ruminococcus albus]|uniref:Uncharacterized protein n=1 Tax=Ruminococcus albus TaxID=1264 RepID=A0A1H7FJ32_RUMAL|nr:hypothetical protein SAMN05216469_101193 [Ruminococcus albus]